MNDWGKEWDGLRRAVEIPASALTAVEVDTEHRAKELISRLSAILEDRPSATVETDLEESATVVFHRCHEQIHDWPSESGVLFVVFKGGALENEAIDFWREMNALRESWAGLQCHVIFFLFPAAFGMLLKVADHLADWILLRLHFIYPEDSIQDGHYAYARDRDYVFHHGRLSPSVAMQNLQRMESRLRNALQKGDVPDLIPKFYLPMLESAVELRELRRAKSIRSKIQECAVSQSEKSRWLQINWLLDFSDYNLDAAHSWAEKLLFLGKENGNFYDISSAYHLLGVIAKERRDFELAGDYFSRSLEAGKSHGNETDLARTFNQLGIIAEEKRDFDTAEYWFHKSLLIESENGNEHGAGISCHQLGRVAQERRDFETAEKWYHKSLAIEQEHGNDFGVSITCHQLGRIAQERKDLDTAKIWYKKSIKIKKSQGNEYGLGITYHNLGQIYQEQKDYYNAQKWYLKSLAIKEKHSNDHGAAITYYALGLLFKTQEKWLLSAQWLLRAFKFFSNTDALWRKKRTLSTLEDVWKEAPVEFQNDIKKIFLKEGFDGFCCE